MRANRTLTGGSGNDFLIAGPNDHLTGGLGNDTFVFNPGFGKDVVSDFNVVHDILAFSRTLFSAPTASQVLAQTKDTSEPLRIDYRGENLSLFVEAGR
jgi:Ca2+-binding RTX toxin-like protein